MVRIAALDDETCWIETLREITQEFFEQREDDEYEFFGYRPAGYGDERDGWT